MSYANSPRLRRFPIPEFRLWAFGVSIAGLVLAPAIALNRDGGSYLPFGMLRIWMFWFSCYAGVLALEAGGFRKAWAAVYAVLALVFTFGWGFEKEVWAFIDLTAAGLVGLSALFLRTSPIHT